MPDVSFLFSYITALVSENTVNLHCHITVPYSSLVNIPRHVMVIQNSVSNWSMQYLQTTVGMLN